LGRRRKKTLRVVHKTLPTVFACPRCGLISIRITSDQDPASQDFVFRVTCGNPNCPLHAGREMRYSTKRANIDVYNTFVDDYAKAGV
jgi:transcription elongation factor Elf1